MASEAARPRIIDGHGHVNWYGYDADRLVGNMDEHDIDLMWLLTWEAPQEELDYGYSGVFWPQTVGMPFKDALAAVSKYPDRFIPFYAPDPRLPDSMRRLEGAVTYLGVRGFGELKIRMMLDDPRLLEMFYFCGEKGLPVIFHMDVPLPRRQLGQSPGYWYCCDWENLARALELCPKTAFIGHAPGYWREISGDADSDNEAYPKGPVMPGGRLWQYMDRYPNLHCDLSAGSALYALSRDPAMGKQFLEKYQDRCIFGRDFFDDRLYQFILSCELVPDVKDKILRGNALRLVPLTK